MGIQLNTGYNLKASLRPLVEKRFITPSAEKALLSARIELKSKIFPSTKLFLFQVSNPKIYEEEEGIFSKSLEVDLLKAAENVGLIFVYTKNFKSCMLLTKKECNGILKGKRNPPSNLLIYSIERQMEMVEGRSSVFEEDAKRIGRDGFIVSDEPRGRLGNHSFIDRSYLGTYNWRRVVLCQAIQTKDLAPYEVGYGEKRCHSSLPSFLNIKTDAFLPYIIEVVPSNPYGLFFPPK